MIKHEERDQAEKNIEVEKPELGKIPRDHRFFKKERPATKKAAAQAESEEMKAPAKKENAAAAAGANCENAETKTD